ncbi:MAG: hypothetical protein JWN56_1492 [Sphingobacteriales bacterium]|nr:hypothetical protein [Sphingobacteriales bacterium]
MENLQVIVEPIQTFNFLSVVPQNEVHNNYKFIKGKLVLSGRQPDGDSVAVIADNIADFKGVYRSFLLKPSSVNGSVQLRFEGIDTPELHYGAALQPFGKEARDYLLFTILGFTQIDYKPSSDPAKPDTTVISSNPATLDVIIATSALETHGRPISYIFNASEPLITTDWGPISETLLRKSINYKMLESGFAYLLAYTSMPLAHFKIFKEVANAARLNKSGVWKDDSTRDFRLTDVHAIEGENAQLIYPKLFRRCIDFFKSGEEELKDWLRKKEKENDQVRITETTIVNMSSLIQQVNDHIYFQADINDIIFIEK